LAPITLLSVRRPAPLVGQIEKILAVIDRKIDQHQEDCDGQMAREIIGEVAAPQRLEPVDQILGDLSAAHIGAAQHIRLEQ
jgi:hypothetical protein